jgi:hypothetical protein
VLGLVAVVLMPVNHVPDDVIDRAVEFIQHVRT